MTDGPDATRPLAGVRIIEISSFVAVPLAGMTLAQLGAEVIRVDPVGGAADYHRWPVTDGRRQHLLGRAQQGQAFGRRRRAFAGRAGPRPAPDRRQRRPDHQCGWAPMAFVRHAGARCVRTSSTSRCPAARTAAPGSTTPSTPGIGFPAGHRPGRTGRPGQPRAARLGRRVRALRRARRHRGAAAPRRHRAGPADQHPAGERRAGDGGQPQLPDRGDGQRHAARADRQLDLRPVRSDSSPAATVSSFMVVALTGRHFRDLDRADRNDRKPLPRWALRSDADFTDEGERYRHRDALTGLFTVWFTEHTAERDRRRAVGDVDPVGALPHLRRGRRPTPKVTANPLFTRTRSAAHRASIWRPVCRCRSTVPIRPRWPAPALGDHTAAVLRDRLGLTASRDRRLIAGRAPSHERAARSARRADRPMPRIPGMAPPAARRASGPSAASSWHSRWPPRAAPSSRRSRRPTCICSSCAAARPATTSTTPWSACSTAAPPPPGGWMPRQDGRLLTTAASVSFAAPMAGPEHGRSASLPGDPETLPRTGPAGPAPSMPLDEIDIRIDDDRSSGEFVRRLWWRATVPLPDDPLLHTLIAATSPTCT